MYVANLEWGGMRSDAPVFPPGHVSHAERSDCVLLVAQERTWWIELHEEGRWMLRCRCWCSGSVEGRDHEEAVGQVMTIRTDDNLDTHREKGREKIDKDKNIRNLRTGHVHVNQVATLVGTYA